MTGALSRWADFSSFTVTISKSASSSFALLKRASLGQAVVTGLVSEMPLHHHAAGHEPCTSLEQVSSKGDAWEHITATTLPWQATDRASWCKQLPSYLTQWMCFHTCFLDTYLHHSPRQCHNTHLPASSHTWGKRSFPTTTKLFHIHLNSLHSPTLLLELCNWLWSLLRVLLPAGYIYLFFLAHFKLLGTTIFLFSARTVPSTARYKPWGRHLTLPYGKLGVFRNPNYQCNTNQTHVTHNKFWRVLYSSDISHPLCPSLSPPPH